MLVTSVFCADVGQHVALIGAALAARNLHTIHLHLPHTGRAAHESVSGTWRRNVLGAIAPEKNDRNFPLQRQPDGHKKTVIGKHTNPTIYKKKADNARRYRYVFTPIKTTRT
jgi:hypothetical protein